MPSREIISSVKRNTPSHAALPILAAEVRRCPSISLLIFFAVRHMIGIGRLTPGVTRDQAQAEMEGVMASLVRDWPDFNTGWTINLVPLREQLVGDVRLAVLVLFGAVGAVLLIACGNIGSLMLTRASGRRRELAIRSAIGAGTGRLLTQLVSESLMLSVAGGALGVVLATWILSGLTTWVGPRLPIPLLSQVTLDPSVMAFAAIVTVLTTLMPASRSGSAENSPF